LKLFTIFGNPVSHSKSPLIHNSVFKKYALDHRYIRTAIEDGKTIPDVMKDLNISGASVTVPHKEVAFQICDEVRGVARDIGAVNCLVRNDCGKIIGYNTDGDGFIHSISDWKFDKILIIGAGGTAKAIVHSFINQGFKNLSIVNRSLNRLKDFENLCISINTWDNLEIDSFDLIVNVTSAGLKDDLLPMPKEILEALFEKGKYVVDAIYHETPFLKLAKEKGLKIKDGSEMLVYQGVLANSIFLKRKISKELIEKEMIKIF
jgi:shikimate dehydrogenase